MSYIFSNALKMNTAARGQLLEMIEWSRLDPVYSVPEFFMKVRWNIMLKWESSDVLQMLT